MKSFLVKFKKIKNKNKFTQNEVALNLFCQGLVPTSILYNLLTTLLFSAKHG